MWYNFIRTRGETNMKKVPGYSNYSVTKDGRVWTHKLRSGWMKPGVDKNGYVRYPMISDNGKRKGMYIHQLVAITYIPNPDNKPNVNHLDHNKSNNSIENLEWCTQKENIVYDWLKGKRKASYGVSCNFNKHPVSLVKKLRQLYDSGKYTQLSLAKKYNIPFSTVHVIVRRKQWRNI